MSALPPILVSAGGIPYNKEHLDDKDAQITALQSRLEAVEAERDAWLRIVADISAAVPIPDILLATKSRKDLTAYFRAKVDRTEAAEARVEELQKAQANERRLKNELVLAAYPAMDAVDAIRKWCDGQQYENDLITVALLREMLPPARALSPARTEEGKP